ncbi:MAG: sirohydrochlorin chelatase [Nitrospirota bacterium]|nr:sirohydrochlorin chelatase [Nitrospirota bacterium]
MSKTVILLIGHGSRNPAGNEEFLIFTDKLRARLPGETIVPCFIELADVLIPEGIEKAVALGATRIIAVPVILLAAGHVKMEVPEILEHAREKHPGVEILYTRNIGVCEQTTKMLVQRVSEAVNGAAPSDDDGVLILGRGSSDPDAAGDIAKISRLFWEATDYERVDYAFVGVTRPDLPTGVDKLIRLGASHVIIAPYFLFTGVLIERIRGMVTDFQTRWPDVRFSLAHYFEYHELLMDVVAERIRQGYEGEMMMACDGCIYRIEAQETHGHHHDHGHHGHDDHDDHDDHHGHDHDDHGHHH